MPITAAISAGVGAAGAIGSSMISSNAADKASQQQAAQAQAALQQQNALFQQGVGLVQPFIDYGKGAGNTLSNLLTPGPNQTAALSQLPGFQFAQDWGQKAVQNIGTTQGLGGNTLAAGAGFATGQAQQSFGSLANLLLGLTGQGAGAASSAFGNATQTGANMANTFTGLGNAQAAGTLGSANALAGGLTGAAGSASNALLLSKLFGGQGGVGAGFPAATGPGIYSGGSSLGFGG